MAKANSNFSAKSLKAGDVVGTLELLTLFGDRRKFWNVRCTVCGTEKPVRTDHLVRYVGYGCRCDANSRSGRPGPAKTHGHSQKREWRIWQKMIARCHNPAVDNFRFYGALGKYVCQRWRDSFEAFHADLGDAPSLKHSVDRIDTLGSYTCGKCDECAAKNQPANCRWATKDVQVRNAKNNLYYTHDGKTLILKDWARLIGMPYLSLYRRVITEGWPFDKAITTPKLKTWSRRKPNWAP